MDRKTVCAKIRDLNLQDEVKKVYGDNYTRISTDKLEALVVKHEANTTSASNTNTTAYQKAAPTKTVTGTDITTDNPFEAACLAFLCVLDDAGVLDDLLDKMD